MKRTTLLTSALAMAIVFALANPADAMRDPGGPAGPYTDGMNLYEYASARPLQMIDPDGRAAVDTVGSANKPFRWREGGKEYRARWEAAPKGVWEKIAAGELDACPATLVLPDNIYWALKEAWRLTLQTNREHGGVITLVDSQFVTWEPIAGSEGSVKVEESAPPAYQKELREQCFGSYHTHPPHEEIVGQGPVYSPFSPGDIYLWWHHETLALVRDCYCTYALLKTREAPNPDKAREGFENELAPYEKGISVDAYLWEPTLADRHRKYQELKRQRVSALGKAVQKFGSCLYKRCPGDRKDLALVGQ